MSEPSTAARSYCGLLGCQLPTAAAHVCLPTIPSVALNVFDEKVEGEKSVNQGFLSIFAQQISIA